MEETKGKKIYHRVGLLFQVIDSAPGDLQKGRPEMTDEEERKILGNGAADCIEIANRALEEIMSMEDMQTLGSLQARRAIQIAGNARRAITDKLVEMYRAIRQDTTKGKSDAG